MNKEEKKKLFCIGCNKYQQFEKLDEMEDSYVSHFKCPTCNHIIRRVGDKYQ